MSAASNNIEALNSSKDTVLIVDDNPKSLALIANYLEEFGIDTLVASSGESALQRARYTRPDIILLDVLMEGIDGFETCRRLKTEEDIKEIPVIFMTALTDTEHKIKGFSVGAVDYITKPIQREELLARINTHLENRKYREQLREEVRKRTSDLEKRTSELELANKQLNLEVNERKRAEKALKQSELELTIRNEIANVFLTIPDKEIYGEVLQVILRATESKYGIFGYINEEESMACLSMERDIDGKYQITDKDIVFPHEMWDAIWKQALMEKKTLRLNESLRMAEENIPIKRALDAPVIDQGEVIGNLFVANKEKDYDEKDIQILESISRYIAPVLNARLQRDRQEYERKKTEQEKTVLEKQLQHAQKMEAIGTLAGGIAHDFNNILVPIVGYTEMVLLDLPEDSTVHNRLKEILLAAERATDLVKHILTFSRQTDHEVKPVKFQLILKEALKLIKSTFPSTIEIHQSIDNNCNPVMADPTHVHQIIMNLCTNAYHAMEKNGGELDINLTEVNLAPEELKKMSVNPGPFIQFTVSDTGVGIENHIIDKIFDPYFTTKEKDKGTGLGLSVVLGIVKSYGGDINVSSEYGKGTVFNVYLPRIESETDVKEAEDQLPLPMGNEHILLVEDEKSIILLEKCMLERLGYKVTGRTSSIEALEEVKEEPDKYDLVITDRTMPHMTGEELSKRLIEIRPDLPVILCTGYCITITEEQASALGIKKIIKKPIITRKMAETVREVLDKTHT